MLEVLGLGWIDEEAYGQGYRKLQWPIDDSATLYQLGLQQGFFPKPIKNFGRFEVLTQRLCLVTALALQDAGLSYGQQALDMGLLTVNKQGCVASNRNFFQDYLDGGRHLSRANLFIYTLPTSASAEAAIYFGLQGPLLFMESLSDSLEAEIRVVNGLLQTGQAQSIMMYLIEESYPVGLVLGEVPETRSSGIDITTLPRAIESQVYRVTEALKRTGQTHEN